MYAIAFDMQIDLLRKNYGEPYNNAYYEISKQLKPFGFDGIQGSVYVTEQHDMANLFAAINALRALDWFRNSVRDIRAFKIEDWSDFTQYFRPEQLP